MQTLVFSYGTLQPKFAPREIAATVARLKRIGRGTVQGLLFDLGDYPGLKIGVSANARVKGTVFEVPSISLMEALDDFEGFDPKNPGKSLFVRKLLKVKMHSGSTKSCWVYIYNGDTSGARNLPSGEYRRRQPSPRKRPSVVISKRLTQSRAGD